VAAKRAGGTEMMQDLFRLSASSPGYVDNVAP